MTTATDVYSLGAVLYETLTSARPARRPPLHGEQSPGSQDVLPPSVASGDSGVPARELRGDLDNVVLKAMHEDPERRYRSVDQFSEDLRRYLQGLPVVARKDTLWYRAGKFSRRNRISVVAAALVLAALATGAATTLWEKRVAVWERGRAERQIQRCSQAGAFRSVRVRRRHQESPRIDKGARIW